MGWDKVIKKIYVNVYFQVLSFYFFRVFFSQKTKQINNNILATFITLDLMKSSVHANVDMQTFFQQA